MTIARSLIAGAVYFLVVFAIGYGLGTLRVLIVIPRIGETAAVLIEAPLMLTASWAACGYCLHRFAVGPAAAARVVMGASAFVLLMAAEFTLAVLVFGKTPAAFVAGLANVPGGIGLAAQVAFGLMPSLRAPG
jgi:hypothetical protein